MATDKKNLLRKKGFEKLVQELELRKTKIRVEIANKLQIATDQGDLSENAAYKAALEEKELNENRIEELETLVAQAEIIDDTDSSIAGIGDKVILLNLETKGKMEFTVVGTTEADPGKGLISLESPFGKAVYGKAVGAEFAVKTPTGAAKYKLQKIN